MLHSHIPFTVRARTKPENRQAHRLYFASDKPKAESSSGVYHLSRTGAQVSGFLVNAISHAPGLAAVLVLRPLRCWGGPLHRSCCTFLQKHPDPSPSAPPHHMTPELTWPFRAPGPSWALLTVGVGGAGSQTAELVANTLSQCAALGMTLVKWVRPHLSKETGGLLRAVPLWTRDQGRLRFPCAGSLFIVWPQAQRCPALTSIVFIRKRRVAWS